MKWGYISPQKLESERSKSFPVFISLQTKPSGASLESPGLENIPQLPGNRAQVSQNHDLRNTDSATITLKKKWGYISAQKLESEPSQRFALSVSMQSKAIRS